MRVIKKIIIGLLFIVFIVLFFSSCTDTCTSQMTANREIKLAFEYRNGSTFVDTTLSHVFISIRHDTMLYTNETASTVSLELNLNSDTSVFYFKTDSIITSKIIDTLTFTYHRDIQLISSECGFNAVFTNLQLEPNYTHNIIDSIILVVADINSNVTINYNVVIKSDTAKLKKKIILR